MIPHLVLQQPTCEVDKLPPFYRYKNQDLKRMTFSEVFQLMSGPELGVTDLFVYSFSQHFFFFFGLVARLAGSQFPDQGLNLGHDSERVES